jgi:hypothetical protein
MLSRHTETSTERRTNRLKIDTVLVDRFLALFTDTARKECSEAAGDGKGFSMQARGCGCWRYGG